MNKSLPQRKTNRLRQYDYSQNGIYHLIICTNGRKRILSEIIAENQTSGAETLIERPCVRLTEIGRIVDDAINNIAVHYDNITVEKYVIMPNHIHLLLAVDQPIDGRLVIAPTVSTVIKQMKTYVTKQAGYPIWQKGYYDHIVKNEADYESVWTYIDENPVKWENDEYY